MMQCPWTTPTWSRVCSSCSGGPGHSSSSLSRPPPRSVAEEMREEGREVRGKEGRGQRERGKEGRKERGREGRSEGRGEKETEKL